MASCIAQIGCSLVVASAPPQISTKVAAKHEGLRLCAVPVTASRQIVATASRRVSVICAAASESTLTKVRGIIAQQLAVEADKVAPESKFVDLGADSLDTVEIMMALEEQFGITLDEDGAEKIATVQEAADLIEGQIVANA
eukprot:TRINITY_DN39145_c0_g1_i1.p1 TRINITY_DN39145_c0_g1~~TRINITY_DN39145_c0_g1_i1.p1  ORF type:complete len:141 (+),score=26.66 TRINITY_DN39145_c0_g1_i1:296-718(+)